MSAPERHEDEGTLSLRLEGGRRGADATRGQDIQIYVLNEQGEVIGKLRRCRVIAIGPISRKEPIMATVEVIGPDLQIEVSATRAAGAAPKEPT